jgi:hypothetical protein
VYRHVLGAFAAELAKYWSPHNKDHINDENKDFIKHHSPDLVACINQLIRQ